MLLTKDIIDSIMNDENTNDLLGTINQMFNPIQEEIEKKLASCNFPFIFVLGPMRSGTTLTNQILTEHGHFARITNFVARFWQAPAVGALIEKVFMNSMNSKSFHSEFGYTEGLAGSNEFGYFWNRWFELGHDTHHLPKELLNKVNVEELRRALVSLEVIYKKPIVFQNPTWFSFQADWLAKNIQNSIFVVCQRNPLYIAQSLIIARRKKFHNERDWWSIKPSNFHVLKNLSVWEQVVAQAKYVEREINETILNVPKDRIVVADYDRVCSNPVAIVNAVIKVSNSLGTKISNMENDAIQPFECKNFCQLNTDDWKKLCNAFDNFDDSKF